MEEEDASLKEHFQDLDSASPTVACVDMVSADMGLPVL